MDEVIEGIVAGLHPWISGELRRWYKKERFRGFATSNAPKLIHKFNKAKLEEDKLDVLAELEIASGLLGGEGMNLDYEPFGAGIRGPDFRVRWSSEFYMEIKRIRQTPDMRAVKDAMPPDEIAPLWIIPYTDRESFKFSDLIVDCPRQFHPGLANVLAIKISSDTHDLSDFVTSVQELRGAARNGNDEYFRKNEYADAKDFLRKIGLLSAIVIKRKWVLLGQFSPCNPVWQNTGCDIPLAAEALELLKTI